MDSLTFEQADKLVRRINYVDHPSMTFKVLMPAQVAITHVGFVDRDTGILQASWRVPDITGQRNETELIKWEPLYREMMTAQSVLEMCWYLVDVLERHERLERLQIDGKPIWEPHSGGSFGLSGHFAPHGEPWTGHAPL